MDTAIPIQIQELKLVEEFNEEIIKHSTELINMALKIVPFGVMTARGMINDDTFKRYKAINKSILLSLYLKELTDVELNDIGVYYTDDDILMIAWISLGSALESSLQIFLTAFKHNYDDNPALKWDEFNIDNLNNEISLFINSIREKEILSEGNIRSFKEDVKKIVKNRKNGLTINKITLSDLMHYFRKNVWSNCSYFEVLEQIRDNRNVIHSFSDRKIGTWIDFEYALKIYIKCLMDLTGTMSYLKDIVDDIISEYSSEMSNY